MESSTYKKYYQENGVSFALTTDKLKDRRFRPNLLKQFNGFDKTKALEASSSSQQMLGKE
jgi:hypothetical protein